MLIERVLPNIAFALTEEDRVSIVDVTTRARAGFDVEKVTKRFYDRFKTEHEAFCKFLKGIPDESLQSWYVSVMLNRLMFIYFIQKKHFLDNDADYLRNRLTVVRKKGKDRYYREFLCPLFFEGFAKRPNERSAAARTLLGTVPYLNGGLFLKHQIEEQHGQTIQIPDAAFERLFEFFDGYRWHLDERPLRANNEINPDVLGYIFEKYINQKQMGAYYTKEDITEYISKSTIIPFLFDAARKECAIAFKSDGAVWRLLRDDPDRYIYEAVRRGVIHSEPRPSGSGPDDDIIPESALPDFVQKGMKEPKERMFDKRYNLGQAEIPGPDGKNLALPTETWREYIARRQRCLELREKLRKGEVDEINDLITLNLDIRQFAEDVIATSEGPELVRAFWKAIAGSAGSSGVTVLDPTCGSGAFLFAALNILEPLYEACLNRMEGLLDDLKRAGGKHHPEKFSDFRKVLDRIAAHPNHRYFVLKSIIINNLFGVDIMEEATEICKLRLFLKLVAQIERFDDIEPLPDIDFNIRAGNTLVGFATLDEVKKSMEGRFDFGKDIERIEEQARLADTTFRKFREMQTDQGVTPAELAKGKEMVRSRMSALESELDGYLAGEYGIPPDKPKALAAWKKSHEPFHWFVDFYGIMSTGGFDVIIGNPPYVVYSASNVDYTVQAGRYRTFAAKNLYAYTFERSTALAQSTARVGLIVQMTVMSSERLCTLQNLVLERGELHAVSFPRRPESVFEGVEMPVSILISVPRLHQTAVTSRVCRFYTEERPHASSVLRVVRHNIRRDGHRIAKIGTPCEIGVHEKIATSTCQLGDLTTRQSKWSLWYQEACRYWTKARVGLPHFKRNGVKIDPPHGRSFCFSSDAAVFLAACVANSSVFYWFYSAFSDCEHINDALIRQFPIPQDWVRTDWKPLYSALSQDLANSATRKTIKTKQGHTIEYDEMRALLSKPLIDEIDTALARHYGFTDEELDFVINYDIKYRMAGSDEDGDE